VGEILFSRVYQAYVDRKLKLPTMPIVALKIREVVKNAELGVSDIARIVQSDPPLTARLIQMANSPIYRGVQPSGSALEAVIRLGAKTTQNLTFVMAISSLFMSRSEVIQAQMTRLHGFSTHLAAACFVIADLCPGLDRERAMLLGLVSHIGAIPILSYAGEDPAFSGNQSVVGNILANLCSITSGLVLRQWGFDSELTLICENCDESRIVDVDQPICYSDVLHAAILIAPENFLGGEHQATDFDSHPLQQKFAAAGIIESRDLFLEKADSELAATRELLNP
jgi:HD-like signal output (HDOD) protein